MNGWTVAWLLWICAFLAIEIPAILDKQPGNTLTEHVRAWFSVRTKPPWWRARRVVLLSFLVWLLVHLTTGWV